MSIEQATEITTARARRIRRLRRAATQQGLRLEASRVRTPSAPTFGRFWLVEGTAPVLGGANWRSRTIVAGGDFGLSLDEAETELRAAGVLS